MTFWKKIWDKKGNSDSTNLLYLDGYEHLDCDFSSQYITNRIIETIGIKTGDSILEVGCGCGFLSRELVSDFDYVGVDYSEPLINKHKKMFPRHKVVVSEAEKLPFDDNSFDYVFCYGVYQYLLDEDYAMRMIEEMKRVARRFIFLGDLKEKATRKEHLPCRKENMTSLGFSISKSFYNPEDCYRYNAHMYMGEQK